MSLQLQAVEPVIEPVAEPLEPPRRERPPEPVLSSRGRRIQPSQKAKENANLAANELVPKGANSEAGKGDNLAPNGTNIGPDFAPLSTNQCNPIIAFAMIAVANNIPNTYTEAIRSPNKDA